MSTWLHDPALHTACTVVAEVAQAHDGSAGTHVYDRGAGDLDYLEHHVLSIPYRIANPGPKVLVIGVGGGVDLYTADRNSARAITGVDLDVPVPRDVHRPVAEHESCARAHDDSSADEQVAHEARIPGQDTVVGETARNKQHAIVGNCC